MRSVIDIGTKQVVNVDNLSNEFKMSVGEMLNSPGYLHVETLYFTANGSFYYVAHEYKGVEKQYKNKKYARFRYENIDVKDNNNNIKRTRKSVPMPEFEIVDEIEAQFFIDEYIRLSNETPKKTTAEMKIAEDKKTEAVFETYLLSLINKAIKK